MAPEQPQDWISSVIRPLRNNPELEVAARRELAERAAGADPGQVADLARRFDAVDAVPAGRRRLIYWLPVALAFVLALGIGIPTAIKYRTLRQFLTSMSGLAYGAGGSPTDAYLDQLTPEQRLFVFGDTSQPTDELAARALWESQPHNPILFAEYLAACDLLPPDFLETAGRIDPDNGWFALMGAGELGKEAIKKSKRPAKTAPRVFGAPPERSVLADWEVKDENKFLEALGLIEEAIAQPRVEYDGARLLQQRLEIFPAERDFPSRVARLIIAASSHSGDLFDVMAAGDVVSAHAYLLGRNKDADTLRDFVPTAEAFCRSLASLEGNLITQLVAQAACRTILEHLLEACVECGLKDEAERLRPKVEAFRAMRKAQRERDGSDFDKLKTHADVLTALAAPAVGRIGVPAPTVEELKPGRMMNYALFDRVSLWSSTFLFLLCIITALILQRLRGSLSFRLGRRFAQLPGPTDWLWIVLLGIIAPLLWLLCVTRLTPLGCRDWGLGFAAFQPISTQYSIAQLLVIASTVCAVRWRLGKHGSALGLGARRPSWSLLPVAALALSIPLAGCFRFGFTLALLYLAGGLAGAAGIWLLFLAGRSVFGRRHHSPYRAAVAATLAPAFALGVPLLLALLPLTHHSERYWIARETILRTSPENYGMGRLEAEGARLLREQIQAALDAKP